MRQKSKENIGFALLLSLPILMITGIVLCIAGVVFIGIVLLFGSILFVVLLVVASLPTPEEINSMQLDLFYLEEQTEV